MKKGLKISALGGGLFLFEFEDGSEAERVLARGSKRLKGKIVHLERWNPEVGCFLKGVVPKELWVRVLGLPLHFWSQEVFKKLGDCCGGFLAVDEDTATLSHLQWARILVKSDDKGLPGSLQVLVGLSSFSIQL